MILVVTPDRAGRDIECDRRRHVKVVAGALIADRRSAVARSPEREIRFRIVVARDPDRGAAGLPLIALRPRLTSRLTRGRHCVGAPLLFAGLGIESCDETTNAELAS